MTDNTTTPAGITGNQTVGHQDSEADRNSLKKKIVQYPKIVMALAILILLVALGIILEWTTTKRVLAGLAFIAVGMIIKKIEYKLDGEKSISDLAWIPKTVGWGFLLFAVLLFPPVKEAIWTFDTTELCDGKTTQECLALNRKIQVGGRTASNGGAYLPKSVQVPSCTKGWSQTIGVGQPGVKRMEWPKEWPTKHRFVTQGQVKATEASGHFQGDSISFCTTNPAMDGMEMPLIWIR